MHGSLCVGAIVCKLDVHKKVIRRGYIAMLAVDENYRKKNIGLYLKRNIDAPHLTQYLRLARFKVETVECHTRLTIAVALD